MKYRALANMEFFIGKSHKEWAKMSAVLDNDCDTESRRELYTGWSLSYRLQASSSHSNTSEGPRRDISEQSRARHVALVSRQSQCAKIDSYHFTGLSGKVGENCNGSGTCRSDIRPSSVLCRSDEHRVVGREFALGPRTAAVEQALRIIFRLQSRAYINGSSHRLCLED